MKWLFFALLAANLALAAFVYVRDNLPNPDAQLISQQINADQIRIVPPRPIPPPAPVAPAPVAGVCVEWGNFAPADSAKAQAALATLALGERVRKMDVAVSTSYRTYIPPLKSKRDMDRKAVELRGLGITEFSPILESGRWRYAISLGFFRTEDTARRQLAGLREKGVRSAQIGEREQRTIQTAFLVRDPTEAQSAQLVNLKANFTNSSVRAVDCPPP
jgi:hypothetical protein